MFKKQSNYCYGHKLCELILAVLLGRGLVHSIKCHRAVCRLQGQ